jgi:hypothetical protein
MTDNVTPSETTARTFTMLVVVAPNDVRRFDYETDELVDAYREAARRYPDVGPFAISCLNGGSWSERPEPRWGGGR